MIEGSGSGGSTCFWTFKLQEKPSILKREHPARKKIKFITCFLFFWVIFALVDPDPGTPLNLDPIRIHNTGERVCLHSDQEDS
jgi:hypothetical protein